MGTGTSVGVPVAGCDCDVCLSENPKNKRYRSGVFIQAPEGNILIDTSPELRLQLIRERIKTVHAVLFTHGHADHIYGLDDLRIYGHRQEAAVLLYCEDVVEQHLRNSFSYAFDSNSPRPHKFAVPRFEFRSINMEPFSLLGLPVQPIRLLHGQLPILGFRLGNVAFCTDVSEIPEESWPLLENLDTLIIDALRNSPHPTHFNVEQALEVVERVKPQRTYFTHISHSLEYEETNAILPEGVELAYDGLRVTYQI
ncbi:MAG: MBL fold metallo-hydrolase [Planctomycetaceae bacterium]|nr:MBL fold metallo-hydrolase [Planctomycetaceae bacterium]